MSTKKSFCDAARMMACAALVGATPTAALAAGGCPWQQDLTLEIGAKEITVPQSVFDPKTQQQSIDGYALVPNVDQLSLQIIGPLGDVWEAALTRLGSKRCTAYYVGKPIMVSEAPPPARSAPKAKVAAR